MELTDEQATKLFTPSEQEQLIHLLKDECPHNKGWYHLGHGHNDDAYECKMCGEIKWW